MKTRDQNPQLVDPIFSESYTITSRNKIYRYYHSYIQHNVLSHFQDNELCSLLCGLIAVEIDDTHGCNPGWYLINTYQICTFWFKMMHAKCQDHLIYKYDWIFLRQWRRAEFTRNYVVHRTAVTPDLIIWHIIAHWLSTPQIPHSSHGNVIGTAKERRHGAYSTWYQTVLGCCTPVVTTMRSLQCNWGQDCMRQINPNGFQSLCCSMYVYDFVAIKLFDFDFDFDRNHSI